MVKKPQTDWEKAARALCRHAGYPENIITHGRPMWTTYLGEAKAVLVAIGRSEDEPPDGLEKRGVLLDKNNQH